MQKPVGQVNEKQL